jgi:hypothetical protein
VFIVSENPLYFNANAHVFLFKGTAENPEFKKAMYNEG